MNMSWGTGDQLRPASVVNGRIGVEEEAEDLVADGVAGDPGGPTCSTPPA